MSDIRDLLETLDKLNERQNWDSLDAIVDRYATQRMTLQDLSAMEQEAKDFTEQGSGFLGGLGAAFRSLVSNESFRVNYVLYHAGEKLGLPGMYGTDGKLRQLNGSQYTAVRVRPSDGRARNIALAQARLNILPQRVQTGFSIPQGGGDASKSPEKIGYLQSDNDNSVIWGLSNGRDKPYVEIDRQGQFVRIHGDAERLTRVYPNATIMNADGTPLNPVDNDAQAGAAPRSQGTGDADQTDDAITRAAAAVEPNYRDNLDDFVASDEKGLANNPEATGAISELNTRIANLGFPSVTSGNEQYNRQAVLDFQKAYNGMGGERIAEDGDFGPNTFRALESIEQRLETIERLVNQTQESVSYKSSISKMLEESFVFEDLDNNQLAELTIALIGIDKFIGAMPEGSNLDSRKETLINGRLAISDHIEGISREPTPNIVAMSGGRITPISARTDAVDNGEENDSETDDVETDTDDVETDTDDVETDTDDVETDNAETAISYTGDLRADIEMFYKTEMTREDAEEFIAAQSLEGKSTTELMDLQSAIRRIMSVLNGNQRVPDSVGDPNGGDIVNRPEAVEVFRTFKDETIMNALRGDMSDASGEIQTFDWGEREGNLLRGSSTTSNGAEFDWLITVGDTVTLEFGSTTFTNVDILADRNDQVAWDGTRNGERKQYILGDSYQNLNNALAYVRDEMLEGA